MFQKLLSLVLWYGKWDACERESVSALCASVRQAHKFAFVCLWSSRDR